MDDYSLLQRLQSYAENGRIPLHMPGHKRNMELAPHLAPLGGGLDITEIDGFDNLHEAEGILAEAMAQAAKLWGSEESFFLVNGSTGGLLAALRTLTKRGDCVLLGRNAHSSVYHAVELCGLRPCFLVPPEVEGWGIFGSLTAERVEDALRRHPEGKAVVLTSPSYEGVLSDVEEICRVAHRRGVPVLVDEAHGAHLGLQKVFPQGAVESGADLVVQSLHKTLPSLTQTAILHAQGTLVSRTRLRHQLAVFQTSSPSYLLLASMDGCVRAVREGDALLRWRENLRRMDTALGELEHLRLLHRERSERIFAHDPGKLLISTRGTSWTGRSLGEALRQRYGIEPEMCAADAVLLMTGWGEREESLRLLAQAVRALDGEAAALPAEEPLPFALLQESVEMVLLPEQALEAESEPVSPEKAVGHIAAEYLWCYPPGIPLLLPGERIPASLPALCRQGAVRLHSTYRLAPQKVAVVKE